MWGPANALLDENISSDQQGLTPRVFERLFARINEVSLSCLCIDSLNSTSYICYKVSLDFHRSK